MLGTRTKQVFAYGRRGQRVINVYDDDDQWKPNQDVLGGAQRENGVPSTALPAKKAHVSSMPENASPSDRKKAKKSPKTLKARSVAVTKPTMRRHVLGSIAPNAPASPAVPPPGAKRRQTTVRSSLSLASASPIVKAEIMLFDEQGRRVSQEHRVLRANVQVNILTPTTKSNHTRVNLMRKNPAVITCDSEDDDNLFPERPRRLQRKAKRLVISDDEDASGSDYAPTNGNSSINTSVEYRTPQLRHGIQRARRKVILSPDSPSSSIHSQPVSTSTFPDNNTPPAPSVALPDHHLPLPPQLARPESLAPFASLPNFEECGPGRSKPRQLTPYRKRPGRSIFPAPPSPPSPTTTSELDLDITFDLAQLALSPGALAEVQRLDITITPHVPEYVRSLLHECAQTTSHEFSAFIQMFPSDPLVRLGSQTPDAVVLPRFQKIGEASFSEVFGIGNVVLKIIPLRDEDRGVVVTDVDSPPPSDARDVLKEIIATKAMGECCSGFVELLRTYVVRGKYPSLLLDLWDEYDERKGSESVRPDTFSVSQMYAIIVLPNGGPDLEAYTFSTPTKTVWRQACSIFWQVTRTLSEAEDLVGFEHRDLHWGQILVKNLAGKSTARRKTRTPMDDPDHGVLVTIIDLGLSRMDALDVVHWTPFDEEVFEGTGDYQFDVYRMMRAHNGDEWTEFRPLTNVMWLHYLALKLLQSKGLRAPPVARKNAVVQPAGGFGERECYDCLKEVEGVLAGCLASIKAPHTGRRKTQAAVKASKDARGVKSAGELLEMAKTRGWVR